jgi:hypothetical protein
MRMRGRDSRPYPVAIDYAVRPDTAMTKIHQGFFTCVLALVRTSKRVMTFLDSCERPRLAIALAS